MPGDRWVVWLAVFFRSPQVALRSWRTDITYAPSSEQSQTPANDWVSRDGLYQGWNTGVEGRTSGRAGNSRVGWSVGVTVGSRYDASPTFTSSQHA